MNKLESRIENILNDAIAELEETQIDARKLGMQTADFLEETAKRFRKLVSQDQFDSVELAKLHVYAKNQYDAYKQCNARFTKFSAIRRAMLVIKE